MFAIEERRDTKIFFVPERVEEARRNASDGRRITNKEIANKLNVSERHISVVLNGKDGVSYALAEDIAGLLGAEAAYLLGFVDNKEKVNSLYKFIRPPDAVNVARHSEVAMIPVVSSHVITGACGPGTAYATEVEWEMEGVYPIPTEELSSYGWAGNSFKIIQAEGRSMEPEIYDGDKVLFAEGVEAGERDIVVISCRNRLFIKGVKSMTERSIVLGAFNWQVSPDIRIELDGPEGDIKILGKVLSVVSIRKVGPLI